MNTMNAKSRRFHGPPVWAAVLLAVLLHARPAAAQVITNVTVVNVTPTSFGVVWQCANSTPSISVYADAGGVTNLAGQLGIEAFPLHTGNPSLTNAYERRVAQAATRQKTVNAGLNLMRITGCAPGTTYFYRLTSTPTNGSPAVYPASGPLPSVTTETANTFVLNSQELILNVVGLDTEGYIVLVTNANITHPLAAVVGDGVKTNQVFFNVCDLFAAGGFGNFAPSNTQSFTAQVLGPSQSQQTLQFALNFTTQLAVAGVTEIGVTSEYATLALGSTALLEGQTGSVPVNFYSSTTVGSLNLLVDIPPGHLTDYALVGLVPQIDVTSVSITPQGGSTSLIQMNTLPGQSLTGAQQIGQLGFRAISNVPSAFVSLRLASATAGKPDASPVNVASAQSGRAVVIGNESLLEALQTNGTRTLVLYGKPATTYTMQYTTNLANPLAWTTASPSVSLTSLSTAMSPPGGNLSPVFYRALEVASQPARIQLTKSSNGLPQLTLTGRAGMAYAIQYTTSLTPPVHWIAWTNVTLVGSALQLTALPPPPAFFRVTEYVPTPPVVQLVRKADGTPLLTLTGQPGVNYAIQYATSLTPPIHWTAWTNVTLVGSALQVTVLPSPPAFFRAMELPAGPPPRLVAQVGTNGTRQLQLYGLPGADHGIYYTPSLAAPINWTLLYHVTPDASMVTVPTKPGDTGTAFYRAVRF